MQTAILTIITVNRNWEKEVNLYFYLSSNLLISQDFV